ncbi:putative Pre-rRNA-processing protein FHL1 [Glarea lozoyensis 74030]|uniref:Putative Pre-rRNA-processing protein FHL1 n=1 Tax=Glarea lozoyensis (strain ATCC 74030 / MF5533) TaxID=1104152 RepID=H0ENZ4_GLAL7|nr:putative Pre-rRNA-processing protein FHL1 [Glarea lozoyensis 74030]
MVYHVTTTQIFPAAPSDSNTALLVWSSADPVQVPPTNALDLEVDAVIGEGAVSKLNATAMTSPDSMTMAAAAEAMTNGDDNPRRASLSQSPHRNDSELAQTQNAVEETLPGGGIVSFAASPTRDLDGGPEPLEDATSVVMESEQTADVPSNSGPVLPEVAHVAFDAPLNHDTVPIPQNVAENLADWSEAQVPETSLILPEGELLDQNLISRDVNAAKNALRREKEEERARLESEASARAPIPHTPRLKKEGSRYTKSIVSESGGILRDGNDSDDEEDRRRRKSRRSKKASKRSKSTKRAALDTAVPVDPETLKPSPHDCPLVGIHPAAKDGVHAPHSAYKSISRRHVKIAYNIRKNYWEAEILGRNGTFIDDKFCHYEQVICLNSGSVLQVGGVVVTFLLPDIPIGKTGAEKPEFEDNVSAIRHSIGGKEMSFDFEDDPREGGIGDSSEGEVEGRSADIESDDEDERERNGDSVDDQEAQDDEEDEDEGEEASYQSIPMDTDEAMLHTPQQQGDLVAMPPKKRGPGRPPKNGIMSKREQQLAKKEALAREREGEMDKSAKPANGQPTVPGKNKVGRPRKHPRPDTPPEPREKRKYTKRKPKEPKEGDAIKQDGSGGEEAPAKEKKEKKPPKPERSPSPTFVESELTEQQLAKPQANYVTLIYEALHESKNGQMSLPQIYRAIQRKYPYFVLKVPTNGWQSSVRHNLSQHHAFRKIERDGKGWMWGIVPGVSIEKEKKKRASPPPQSHPAPTPPAPVEKESPSSEDFRSAIEGSVELNAAVERFKTNLIDSLKITKTLDPEKIVNSAINRVLGRATVTSVPGDSEALITRAFKNMLVTNMSTLKYTPNHEAPPVVASVPCEALPAAGVKKEQPFNPSESSLSGTQIIGQKREREPDMDEMPDAKKLAISAPPELTA